MLQEHNIVFEEELRDLGLTAAQLAALRAALTGRRADGSRMEEQEDGRSGAHASPRLASFVSIPRCDAACRHGPSSAELWLTRSAAVATGPQVVGRV